MALTRTEAANNGVLVRTQLAERLPLRVPQVLIWGGHDSVAPRALFAAYEEKATKAGDAVTYLTIPGAGHHDLMSPELPGYRALVEQIRRLLGN